jgi:hypothetical protein
METTNNASNKIMAPVFCPDCYEARQEHYLFPVRDGRLCTGCGRRFEIPRDLEVSEFVHETIKLLADKWCFGKMAVRKHIPWHTNPEQGYLSDFYDFTNLVQRDVYASVEVFESDDPVKAGELRKVCYKELYKESAFYHALPEMVVRVLKALCGRGFTLVGHFYFPCGICLERRLRNGEGNQRLNVRVTLKWRGDQIPGPIPSDRPFMDPTKGDPGEGDQLSGHMPSDRPFKDPIKGDLGEGDQLSGHIVPGRPFEHRAEGGRGEGGDFSAS